MFIYLLARHSSARYAMSRLQRLIWSLPRMLQSRIWQSSAAIAPIIAETQPVEEENTPYYDPKRFYPARLGQVLNGRYQIATKLGYGTSSTVWLARDLSQWLWSPERYVAIKINAADRTSKRIAEHELQVSQLISKTNPRHEGWHFVRILLDSFVLKGPSYDHVCLVFEPLREPLWLLKTRFGGNAIPSDLLKIMVQMLLHGLEYLHSECSVVHTDLKPDNIMVRLEDKSLLEKDAHNEFTHPLPQKMYEDRVIYLSRNDYGQPTSATAIVSITDFGLAVLGAGPHYGCIQAEPYRAPEVILDAGWTYSADVWSLGIILWDLLEDKVLFEDIDPLQTEYDDQTHLAYITALLGPPPEELLARGKRTSMFYDSKGKLRVVAEVPKDFSLENSISKISGEEKRLFLAFVRRMLKWQPKDRSMAKDLLGDPWLNTSHSKEPK